MNAIFLNATLKSSPQDSNTDKPARYVANVMSEVHEVTCQHVRLVDHDIAPGESSDAVRASGAWPALRRQILDAEILVIATPTWLGQSPSVAKRVIEWMDGLIAETDTGDAPPRSTEVAGVIVTGNEDSARHSISEIAAALIDAGYTIPGQAWTYWNKGPGPGEEQYGTSADVEWTHQTGQAMAHVLTHAARALARTSIPKPPNA